jgi:hypothetical protein
MQSVSYYALTTHLYIFMFTIYIYTCIHASLHPIHLHARKLWYIYLILVGLLWFRFFSHARICIHPSCDIHVVGLPYFDAMCFSSHIHTCIYYNSNTHTHTQLRTFTWAHILLLIYFLRVSQHTYTHAHIPTHAYMHLYAHMEIHTFYVSTYTHTHRHGERESTNASTHICTRTHITTHMHACTQSHMLLHTYILRVTTHSHKKGERARAIAHTHTHPHTHACTHVYTLTNTLAAPYIYPKRPHPPHTHTHTHGERARTHIYTRHPIHLHASKLWCKYMWDLLLWFHLSHTHVHVYVYRCASSHVYLEIYPSMCLWASVI